MKTKLILLASFAIGTAAIAQEATPPATNAAPVAAAPAPDATPAAPAAGEAAPASAPLATDGNAQSVTESADASAYPPCSRGVVDKCVQTHERRARPRH
jgi:hypothetical protein